MALQLVSYVGADRLSVQGTLNVPGGERLKLLQTDGDNPNIEQLNAKCPNGRKWEALVTISIVETDA